MFRRVLLTTALLSPLFVSVASANTAAAEWKALPPKVLHCLNMVAQRDNVTLEAIIASGVRPSDTRIAPFVQTCTQLAKPMRQRFDCTLKESNGNSIETLCREYYVNDQMQEISYDEALRISLGGRNVQIMNSEIPEGLKRRQQSAEKSSASPVNDAGDIGPRLLGKCKSAYAEWSSRAGSGAFAISENGACGYSFSAKDQEDADTRAINECTSWSQGLVCDVIARLGEARRPPAQDAGDNTSQQAKQQSANEAMNQPDPSERQSGRVGESIEPTEQDANSLSEDAATNGDAASGLNTDITLIDRLPSKAPECLLRNFIADNLDAEDIVKLHDALEITRDAQSPTPAGELWRELEKKGSVQAIYYVALDRDVVDNEALIKYRQAAAMGLPRAMGELGLLMTNGSLVSLGVGAEGGLQLMEKAARCRDPRSVLALGWLYGEGVYVTKDKETAIKWYENASQLFDFNLRDTYANTARDRIVQLSGGTGSTATASAAANASAFKQWSTQVDRLMKAGDAALKRGQGKDALMFYENAFSIGHQDAAYDIAKLYESGSGGISQDYTKALNWFLEASISYGWHAWAWERLGKYYEEGIGVPRNLPVAIQWYRKSADKGSEEAINHLVELGQSSGVNARGLFVCTDPIGARQNTLAESLLSIYIGDSNAYFYALTSSKTFPQFCSSISTNLPDIYKLGQVRTIPTEKGTMYLIKVDGNTTLGALKK